MKRASSSSSSNSARWASGTFARSASRRFVKSALAIRLVRGAEDGADQHLGHLERVLVGDVVARDEAVADLVEIRLQRLADAVRPIADRPGPAAPGARGRSPR